jgi:hypothetical protein
LGLLLNEIGSRDQFTTMAERALNLCPMIRITTHMRRKRISLCDKESDTKSDILDAAMARKESEIDSTAGSISDPGLVITTIAARLGVPEERGRSLAETLQAYLHDRTILLVLDNFEQVLAATPRIAELLAVTRQGTRHQPGRAAPVW